MTEKLCLFCNHFRWSKEEMWGMGSTMTGPMFEGGSATCGKGHADDTWLYPDDEKEYRKIVLHAQTCPDYDQVEV
jgi:hypothetical protein